MSPSSSRCGKRSASRPSKTNSPRKRHSGSSNVAPDDEYRRLSGNTMFGGSMDSSSNEGSSESSEMNKEFDLGHVLEAANAREAHLKRIYPDIMLLELEASNMLPIDSPPLHKRLRRLVFPVIEASRAIQFVPRIVGTFDTAREANQVVMDRFAIWYRVNTIDNSQDDDWIIDAHKRLPGKAECGVKYEIEKRRDPAMDRSRGLLSLDLERGAYHVWADQQAIMSAMELLSSSATQEAEALGIKAWTRPLSEEEGDTDLGDYGASERCKGQQLPNDQT